MFENLYEQHPEHKPGKRKCERNKSADNFNSCRYGMAKQESKKPR
ncbi:hypothetical protein [Pseudoalteromonas obscura]|uniref:Uncharacterized protein n=1 Tax=Pseudoalteromonas obscura TaxID=3048491 RepID=A0ABT7EH95_9GAMM|nr:hypothetical protein [Pseudoalteromonas sp. P94(2023)]MDK2594411.1 hypothetical protein [Pseudoalteromonas sp. P94(2023)]